MCYLPKLTFYVYFGFFFLGYIWVFVILFYNTWEDGKKKASPLKIQESGRQQPAEQHLGSISEIHGASVEFRPVPYFDIHRELRPFDKEPPCPELVSEPKFNLCLHDPNLDKGISAHISVYREWEKELTQELKSVLSKNPGSLFVDVGSNIGYYSLLAAQLGHVVISIEPFPDNLHLLHHSANLNHLADKLTVIPAAVSDRRGKLTLADDPENFGGRFVIATEEQHFAFRTRKKTELDSILLDDLLTVPPLGSNTLVQVNRARLRAVPKVDIVLKIDIQGHECHAIRGAQQLLQRVFVSPIFMEWEESRKLEENRPCLLDMLNILDKNGYRAFALDGRMLTNLDPSDLTIPQDIVWRKIKRK